MDSDDLDDGDSSGNDLPVNYKLMNTSSLRELYQPDVIEVTVPENVYGDVIVQVSVTTAVLGESGFRLDAIFRASVSVAILLVNYFLQILITYFFFLKVVQAHMGQMDTLRSCMKRASTNDSCSTDQLCGDTSWRTICTPGTPGDFQGPSCVFQEVYDSYYTYFDASENHWPYVLGAAVFCWLCAMFSELQETELLARSIVQFPTRQRNSIVAITEEKELAVVGMTSGLRAFLLLIIIVPKLLICCGITYTGVKFLVYTDNLLDLVLNAVALGFIVEIDELIYAGVIGFEKPRLFNNIQPLQVKVGRCCLSLMRWHLVKLGSMLSMFVASILIVVYVWGISDRALEWSFIRRACAPVDED